MFLKTHRIFKDGKEHLYYSLCESLRGSAAGASCSAPWLHLGELNTTQRERWQRTTEVIAQDGRRHQMRLFAERRGEQAAAAAPQDVAEVLLVQSGGAPAARLRGVLGGLQAFRAARAARVLAGGAR